MRAQGTTRRNFRPPRTHSCRAQPGVSTVRRSLMTAARKKKLPSGRVRSVTPEAFAAFAQEVRGQFAEIGNQFKGFDARLVDLREHMDQRFDQVDARFGRVDED